MFSVKKREILLQGLGSSREGAFVGLSGLGTGCIILWMLVPDTSPASRGHFVAHLGGAIDLSAERVAGSSQPLKQMERWAGEWPRKMR